MSTGKYPNSPLGKAPGIAVFQEIGLAGVSYMLLYSDNPLANGKLDEVGPTTDVQFVH
jgi:hypothetical protein